MAPWSRAAATCALHLLGRVVPVLNPRHELHPRALHLAAEVRQRAEHRLAGLGARAREAELAAAVQDRIRHRRHVVDVLRDPARNLADAEVARRREAEDGGRDPRAAGLEPLLRVLDEVGDDASLGDARPARIDGAVGVAVGGEADVVEHDLVEPGVGGGLRDGRAVVPDAPIVGIDPAEAGRGRPDAPVGALDGEVGTLARQSRVLEAHDAADHVDAVAVSERDQRLRVVEEPVRADRARQRHVRGRESDLSRLVLDVELDRVEAVALVVDVLLELAGQRRESARHMHPADLDGERPWARPRRRRCGGCGCLLRLRARLRRLVADEAGAHDNGDDDEQEERQDRGPTTPFCPARLVPSSAETLVRVHRSVKHGHRITERTASGPPDGEIGLEPWVRIAPWFSPTGRSRA